MKEALALMRGTFDLAGQYASLSVGLQVANLICLTFIFCFPMYIPLWIVLLVPITLLVCAFGAEQKAQTEREKAEAMRISFLLSDGLGEALDNEEWKHHRANASPRALKLEKRYLGQDTPSYYASHESPGPKRLLENTHESCFYSLYIAKQGRMAYWIITLILLALVIFLLVLGITNVRSREWQIAIVQVSLAILLFASTGPVARTAVALGHLTDRLKLLNRDIHQLKGKNPSKERVVRLAYEYYCATVSAPQLPGWVYKIRRAHLDAVWKSQQMNAQQP